MSVNTLPTCPTDCTGQIPSVLFSDCAPEFHSGQIRYLYFARADAADLTDVTNLPEWLSRLSLDGTDADVIRRCTVIGEKPVPEKSELKVSDGRFYYMNKTHSVNFEIDETNETNYGLLLWLECNIRLKFWYETFGGKLYGGNTGELVSVTLDDQIPREATDIEKYIGTAKWEKKTHPLVCTSPMI